MDNLIIIAFIGLLQAVAVAFIGGLFSRDTKNHKAEQNKMDRRAKLKAQESLLSMKLMSANTKLTTETILAVTTHRAENDLYITLHQN